MELAKLPPLQRIPLLARYARIFAAELFGTVLAVPFGLRAFSLHRSLPDARQQRAGSSVSILRDVRCAGQGMGPHDCCCCWLSAESDWWHHVRPVACVLAGVTSSPTRFLLQVRRPGAQSDGHLLASKH